MRLTALISFLITFAFPTFADPDNSTPLNKCVHIRADLASVQAHIEDTLNEFFQCIASEAKSDVVLEVKHKIKRRPEGGLYVLLEGYVIESGEITGNWKSESYTYPLHGFGTYERDELAIKALRDSFILKIPIAIGMVYY